MQQRSLMSEEHRPDRKPAPPALMALEALIRRDPGQRGLCSTDLEDPLCSGDLAEAGLHLAEEGAAVAIVTGFWVPHAKPAACETDGPLGALFLASVLNALGIPVWLITDALGVGILSVGLQAAGLPSDRLIEFPDLPLPRETNGEPNVPLEDWLSEFYRTGPGSELTHLIAIERVGPSHTVASLQKQTRNCEAPVKAFLQQVPPEHQDHYHNMLGHVITEHHAPTHRLFEFVSEQGLPICTIGIGDGGNEIGMGRILWEEVHRRVSGGRGGLVACRVATHYNVVAGASNWGGYALAAALLWWRRETHLLRPFDRNRELHLLETLVREGPAVDGITLRQEATVDGLPFETYIQALEGIRRIIID